MNIRKLGALAALLVAIAYFGFGARPGQSQSASPSPAAAASNVREITLVNIKYEGSNIWVPGPIVCKKGDHVKLRLINNVKDEPPEHGFAIDEYGIKEVVKRGEPKTVEFDANQAGVFRCSCQLHLPHVGTQLVVLE